MLQEQIISMTDLRYKTKSIIESLSRWPKYVLLNNKLEAVILTPAEYEHFRQLQRVEEMNMEVEEAVKSGKSYNNGKDLIDDLLR